MAAREKIAVAGHLCLDVIPALPERDDLASQFFIPGRLEEVGPGTVATGGVVSNTGVSLFAPCFQTDVVGTTGTGDTTIAGFLAAYLHGETPQQTATIAVAAGACCTESLDATSAIPCLIQLQQRIRSG